MDVAKSELASFSRMFSSAVVRELGQQGRSALLARLLAQSSLPDRLGVGATVGEAFDLAFRSLRSLGNRDEYVYRSAITQKILLGQHSLRSATMLGEARVGMRKADVIVLNGTSTAYEIKSERDSLARLHNQVTSYSLVFAAVNVVTSPNHLEAVLRQVPADVGVLVLSKRFTLRTVRTAVGDPSRTDPVAVLDFVRAAEASAILHRIGIDTPNVPNTQLRSRLRDIFVDLDPADVHEEMVTVLKETRSQRSASDFIASIPMSLRAAMLTLNMDSASRKKVHDATLQPLGVALAWR